MKLARWLLAAAPLLFYANIYFGLRWLEKSLVEVFLTPIGMALLLLMSAGFISRALTPRLLPSRLIFIGLGVLMLGIFLSLTTRQNESLILREGQSGRLGGKPLTLRRVDTFDSPSFLITRDQVAEVTIGSRRTRFGVLPWRDGVDFFHTIRFGFSPDFRVVQNGRAGPWLDLSFGPEAIDAKYNKLIPRRPPPRLMLGVGMYPPETETLFRGKGNKVFFIRLEQGVFEKQRRSLTDPDYFLWLTSGRMTRPVYRLMVWRGPKQIFNQRIVPGRTFEIEGEAFEIGALRYWVEIGRARDYGLPLVLAAWMVLGTGLVLMPVWGIARFSRRLFGFADADATPYNPEL